jgi:RimJ/RimL family protein N-acetyltransferase
MLNLQPTLENHLVLLRPLAENDFDALYEVAKDPLIWEQHPSNDRWKPAVFRQFFDDGIASKGAMLILDKSTLEIIGSSRFHKVNGLDDAVEIGWTFLARKYWGGFYNGSIKKLMIDHAFDTVDNVVFNIGKTNFRSQKAVEKIGGYRITRDTHKDLIELEGDHVTYLIRKTEWEASNRPN